MSNGLMNVASMPAAQPVIAREAPAAAAAAPEGTKQAGSEFAKQLDEQQSSAKKDAPVQSEQAAKKETPVKSEQMEQAQTEDSEKSVEKSVLCDVTALLAFSGYFQAGLPVVSTQAALPIDEQQNAAMATELSAVITAPPVSSISADLLQNVAVAAEEIGAQIRATDKKSADLLQNVAVAAEEVGALIRATDKKSADLLQNVAVTTEEVGAQIRATDEKLVTTLPLDVPAENQHSEPVLKTASGTVSEKALTEAFAIRQHHGHDPRAEKTVDLNTIREADTAIQTESSDVVSMVNSESSSNSDSSQGESAGANGNPNTAQNMSGHSMAGPHKVASAATTPASTEPLRQDISDQVMPQIKERLDQHELKPGKQQITLTLSPDTLGELKMNLNLQGQKLSIEIVTENRSVREAIMQHVDALKETLARQNITMESFDVTTGGKGSGNQGQNHNAWRELMQQQQQQQQQSWTSSRGYSVAQVNPLSEAAIHKSRIGEPMLDIHY